MTPSNPTDLRRIHLLTRHYELLQGVLVIPPLLVLGFVVLTVYAVARHRRLAHSAVASVVALAMLLFALGTVPLMLASGALLNLTRGKARVWIGKIAAVLILLLSVSMLNRGMLDLGVDASRLLPEKYLCCR